LVAVQPQLNLYDKNWPIRTYQRQYPPAKFVFADEGKRVGTALDSIVSSGCIVSGGRVERSVLSPDVRVNSYSHIEQSILFPHVVVGRHSKIRRAIIDRGVTLPEHTVIGYDPDADRERYVVSENGIVVVSPEPDRGEETE
jgi:glucose-1-phosphate adenylyltransferase